MIFNCYSLHVSYLPHPNSGMQLSRKVWGAITHLIVKWIKSRQYTEGVKKGVVCTAEEKLKGGEKVRSLSFYGKPGDWLDKMVVEHSTVVTFDL